MKMTPEELDELLSEGFVEPPPNFEKSVMARIESEAITLTTSLPIQIFRAVALLTGVGVGVSQAMRFLFGIYFVGALN